MHVHYRFCPNCAYPLEEHVRFGRLRSVCVRCGFIHFQEPKVAVGVLVEDGQGRVLLVRRNAAPGLGKWALPSGFMDHDEEPRAAARREVHEETGLYVEIGIAMEVSSLDGNDERRGIIIFFSGKPTGGALQAGDDVSEARWFAPSDIPYAELAFSGMAALLEGWAERSGRTQQP